MPENKRLLTEIEEILLGLHCKVIAKNLPCSYELEDTTECHACQLTEILSKFREVVEGAVLEPDEIWACLKDAETSQEISYYKAVSQAQLQAILKAIDKEGGKG